MKLAVIGTGYVGLVTSAVFANFGNEVWGVDIDKDKINSLKKGKVPFYEPGLEKLIKKNLKEEKLRFTTSYKVALKEADIVFICVGTPAKKGGDYNLSYIRASAKSIGENLKNYTVVCIKSTVPPGTGDEVKKIIKKKTNVEFDIASCPEFLREGSALKDSLNPSRIVIGAESEKAKKLLLKLHKPIKAEKVITNVDSAQLIKYAANSFLATKISFINSIARLCDETGADIDDVAKGLGLDPRIGKHFLRAGIGYGGSCFPKDTWALIAFARRLGYDFKFLKEVDRVNKNQVDYFVEKIEKALRGSLEGKTISVLGLSFKPKTDDMREARSVPIIKRLQEKGAKIRATDPEAIENAKKVLNNVRFFKDAYKALEGSLALVLITEWEEYKELDFDRVGKLMKKKVVVDGRNIYDAHKLKEKGFYYTGIGRI